MFEIVTDTAGNLPTSLLEKHHISVIPLTYNMEGRELACIDTDAFDGHDFYEKIRSGVQVNTSQVTPQIFIDHITPILKAGHDVVVTTISSGISGTFHSACIAKQELEEEFPDRKVVVIDTVSASLAEGMVTLRALELREVGLSAEAAEVELNKYKMTICQTFTVDDLMHLMRTGRCSAVKARIGTVLGIKPILVGSTEGKIIITNYARGQKGAFKELCKKFDALAKREPHKLVTIAHSDNLEGAEQLAEMLKKLREIDEVMIEMYEPVTGAHVGPGTIALFYEGYPDAREKITQSVL